MMKPYKHLFINDERIELRVYDNFESTVYIGYNDGENNATIGVYADGLQYNRNVEFDGVDVI